MKPFDHPAHGGTERLGVLLVNSGTPDSTSIADVRRFLAGLLGDPRVVELPRWLWLPLLHGVILRTRPFRSARKYRQIWTPAGSPLLLYTAELRSKLQQELGRRVLAPIAVEAGMLYSSPSVASALERLRDSGARRILVVPMFPQYSGVATGAVFDQVADVMRGWRWIPELRFISEYHDYPAYLAALRERILNHWRMAGRTEHVVIAFHGIPEKYFAKGDPYFCKCHKTARLLADELGLTEQQWTLSFQSRFGPGRWLKPYTDEVLELLPAKGVREVTVVSPGFAVDCLETLEEIALEGRKTFLEAGGLRFEYVPALNADPSHASMFADLIVDHTSGWISGALEQLGATTTSSR